MDLSFTLLIPIVYALVETLEKFGLKRKYAHLLAIPLGILVSFLGLDNLLIREYVFYGILIGVGAVGTCDTLCNAVGVLKDEKDSNANENKK
ncbi:hypothetical protein [Petroclostridium sp. X23]|uniref:hypothetical protein n=1 Tax=Petroclostridium sp. X23 TaxID=3045146 RepID=UPI0024AE7C59|nr:hypothetical protein [Petroclostridium sp. X23]WHH57882.1 hypothetical protein QKW49_19015 [Petroclostridium sp. X23]